MVGVTGFEPPAPASRSQAFDPEPVTMSSFWLWQPGETVRPYECIETPGSWSSEENKTLLENWRTLEK